MNILVWLFLLLFSIVLVYMAVGLHLMTLYFPESRYWWMPLAQVGSLGLFAYVVLHHPF